MNPYDHSDLTGGREVHLVVADGLPQDIVEEPYDGMVVFAEVDQRAWEYSTHSGWRPFDPTPEELRTAHKRALYVQEKVKLFVQQYEARPQGWHVDALVEEATERIPGVVRPFQPTQFEGNSSQ